MLIFVHGGRETQIYIDMDELFKKGCRTPISIQFNFE